MKLSQTATKMIEALQQIDRGETTDLTLKAGQIRAASTELREAGLIEAGSFLHLGLQLTDSGRTFSADRRS